MWINKPPAGVPLIPDHPQLDGLVGWWLFQEGAGGIVNDLSGNGNTGTLNNFAFPPTAASGWNPGKFGRTVAYDGTNDYIAVGPAGFFQQTDPFTISVLVRTSTANTVAMVAKWDALITPGWQMVILSGRVEFYIVSRGGSFHRAARGTSMINDGDWHSALITYNGSSSASGIQCYIDGKPETMVIIKDTNPGTLVNSELRFGQRENALLSYFNGQLDDVRIYNRALTQAEIRDVMQRPFAAFATMDIAMLAQLANLMAMERSISRRVHGRVFGRVN